MKPRDPRRALVLKLRRMVKVSTRHDVRQVGPLTEELICRECGHVERQDWPEGSNPNIVKRFIAYRGQPSGILGVCQTCSKRAAEERYPLPKN